MLHTTRPRQVITASGLPALALRLPGPLPPRTALVVMGAEVAVQATRGGRSPFWSNFAPNAIFGFFDNYLMILAGELIEKQIRNYYPGAKKMDSAKLALISAGLGNTLSDVFGVSAAEALMGNVFERAYPGWAPTNDLGSKSLGLHSSTWGKIFGIATGCLLGLYGGVNAKWLTGAAFAGFTAVSMAQARQNTGVAQPGNGQPPRAQLAQN